VERACNVLITSVSAKVPLALRFRAALDELGVRGRVIGADSDPLCVARPFLDELWEMPGLDEIDERSVLDYCLYNEIGLVVPTRDGELPFMARLGELAEPDRVVVAIGAREGVAACLDKLEFADRCEREGIPAIPTSTALGEVSGEVLVVKERFGAGARFVVGGVDREAAAEHARSLAAPIFQPHREGIEHSIDLYVGRDGSVVGVVPRVRSRVRHGESVVTETVDSPPLVELAVRIAEVFGLRGHAVVQAFSSEAGVEAMECNPRVGGASTLAFEAGLRFPAWAILEALGEAVEPRVGDYERGLRLIRYPADHFERP
jgi:carbamoyl-phosphate synthase large subunit